MAKRKRDYAKEYARRIALAVERGYSRAVARGHARKHEVPAGTLQRAQRAFRRYEAARDERGYTAAKELSFVMAKHAAELRARGVSLQEFMAIAKKAGLRGTKSKTEGFWMSSAAYTLWIYSGAFGG